MRIDDPIFSGSVQGSDAVVSLSGSFTGSGTIENAATASKLKASASFGLGMESFNFDGSTNQVISIDTASAHFISGALEAVAASTGSFVVTGSISGLTQSFTKGDGSTFDINLPDTGAVDLLFEITGALGVDPFTFDNTADAQVQVNTSSAHFIQGASAVTASLSASLTTTDQTISSSVAALSASASTSRTALSASLTTTDQTISSSVAALSASASTSRIAVSASLTTTDQVISSSLALLSASAVITASITATTMSFTKGDLSTFDVLLPSDLTVDTSSLLKTSSISGLTQSFTKGDGSTYDNLLPDTGSFITTASYSTGSIGGTPNTMSFTKGDGSTFDVTLPNTVTSVTPSTLSNFLSVGFEDGTTVSSGIFTSSYANSSSNASQARSASIADRANKVTASLSQALGIETFTFDGGAAATVQLDTSSAHFTNAVNAITSSLSASLTTTDQTISSSVAALSASASTSRIALSASLTTTDQTISSSVATLSGSASTARNTAALQVSGAFSAQSASLTATDQIISSSVAALSASASTSRLAVSASLTATDQVISSSVAALSASTSTAREFYIITGSISGLTQSFTKGNGSTFEINLPDTGSPTLSTRITGALGVDPFIFNGTADAQVQVNTSSAHFIQGASAVTASLSASLTATDQTISSSVAALSASASTSRLAVSASLTATDQTISSSIVTISASLTATDQSISSSVALLSASAITNVETSSARQVDTLTITKGDGSTFDVTHDTSSFVKTVNGVAPNVTTGNVAVSLASVETGTSASMLAASSSGNLEDGDVWIVSGETADPLTSSNGEAYIFSSASGLLYELSNLDQVENDVRYVNVTGDTMTGALILSQDPTNVLGAATKQYVDPAFTTASMATGSDGRHTVTFTRLGGGTQTLTFTSASYAATASRVTASLTQGLGIENFDYMGGAAQIVQLDTSSAHFTAGVSQSFGSTFANISGSLTGSVMGTASAVEFPLTGGLGIVPFYYVGASTQSVVLDTSSAHFITGVSESLGGQEVIVTGSFTGSFEGVLAGTASRVESALTGGLGVDTFTYDGSVGRGVQINTSSLHFRTGATASIVGNVINPSSVIVTKDISVVADSRISSSAESRNYVEVHDTAHGAGAMELAAIDDIYLVSNVDSGSAGDIVFASNISGTLASETMRIINNNAAANKGLVFVQNDVSASNFIGTSSISLGKASQGVAITMSTYDGSGNTVISLDTSSLAFAEGVAEGMSSASYAGLTIDFSGSNLDFTLANLSGSDWNFSGSTIDFSDVNFSGSTINWSGSTVSYDGADLDFSGATINVSGSTWNWSGSNFDLTDANLSGSRISFSGSTLDLSGAVINANTASYSGSFNYAGSTINGGSYVGASFSGSSAFTGSFDFSNATITGLSVSTNYLPTTQSANFTAAAGRAYIVTASSGVVTMTLPATPSNGDSIKLANMDDRATIIARNGERIMGRAEDMTLNVEQVSFELMYESSTNMGWVIYGARAIT